MKKIFFLIIASSFLLTSCYVHTYTVGDGVQKGISTTAKQHNFIFGLASGKTPDCKEMAKGASDYVLKNEVSFVDGLICFITSGIYCPTTVSVER